MGLFHVEIQTEDRDLTTVPNLYLVSNPVKVTRSSGTIVSAKVSLGYDVPYPLIKKQLVSAGESAGLQDVYVQVKDLGDFSVTYRVAGLLKTIKNLLTTRSILREMMLDRLHEAGIEIVSPSFMNQRHLPETTQFIPEISSQGTSSRKVPAPEEIVFDKAEEAKSIENLIDRQKELSQQLETLKLELSEASQENDRRRLQNQIEHIEKLQVTLNEKIELLKENVDRE